MTIDGLDEQPLYLADTGILLGLARRGEFNQRLLNRFPLFTVFPLPLVSYVSVAEIRVIAEHRDWGRAKREQLDFVLSLFRVFHIHEPGMMEAYIRLEVFCRNEGLELGKNDLWVAATASITGATLLTTDRDFDRIPVTYLNRIYIDPHNLKADT